MSEPATGKVPVTVDLQPSGPAEPLCPAELAALLRADQHRRWQRGERALVEGYLKRYPELCTNTGDLVDLIHTEVLLRESRGEPAALDEYLQRFPEHETALRRRFALLQAVQDGRLLRLDVFLGVVGDLELRLAGAG